MKRWFFVIFSLFFFFILPQRVFAQDCVADLNTVPVTTASTFTVTVTNLDEDNIYNMILWQASPRRNIINESKTAHKNDANVQFSIPLTPKNLSPGTYNLTVRNASQGKACSKDGDRNVQIALPQGEECKMDPPKDLIVSSSRITFTYKNSGLPNKTYSLFKNWSTSPDVSVAIESVQSDAQGVVTAQFDAPSRDIMTLRGNVATISLSSGVSSTAQTFCKQEFEIKDANSIPVDLPTGCSVYDTYRQCGATEGCTIGDAIPISTDQTVLVNAYSCQDGTTGFKCKNLKVIAGECGNAASSTQQSCAVCLDDKPAFDATNSKCCAVLYKGTCPATADTVNPGSETCTNGLTCVPGNGCGKYFRNQVLPSVAPACKIYAEVNNDGEPIKTMDPATGKDVYSDVTIQVKNGTVGEKVKYKCVEVATAIGGIETTATGVVKSLFSIILGLSGGIAIILIITSGYMIMTSQGNAEKLQKAREILTSAIVGILFMIFSMVILNTIGIDILAIPGLTK